MEKRKRMTVGYRKRGDEMADWCKMVVYLESLRYTVFYFLRLYQISRSYQ